MGRATKTYVPDSAIIPPKPTTFSPRRRAISSTPPTEAPVSRHPFSSSKFFIVSRGKAVIVALAALTSLCACAPQSGTSVPEAEKATVSAGDPFAVAVSRMTPGQQAVMATPYGADSLVALENVYTSGLGLSCSKAQVTASGATHRLAICRDDSGWYVSDPIFEQSQR